MNFGEIVKVEIQVNPLVTGFLAEDDPAIIYSKGGVGKSLLTTDLSMYLGAGLPSLWDRFEIPSDRSSLFVQAENSMGQQQERISKKIRGNHDFVKGLQNVHCAVGDHHDLRLAGRVKDKTFQQEIIDLCDRLQDENQRPIDIIFFDPLISYHAEQENSTDMRPALDAILKIAVTVGATPVVVHHANKNDEIRGSSGISDWARNIIRLEDVSFQGEKRIKVTHEKSNNAAPFDPIILAVDEWLNFATREIGDTMPATARKRCEAVLEALKMLGGNVETQALLIRQYRENSQIGSNATAKNHINEADRYGYITRVGYQENGIEKARYLCR